MQQKWWLIAAGAVGIALAVLLFPKPDTEDLPEADLTRHDPLDFKAGNDRRKNTRQVRVAPIEARRADMVRAQRVPASRMQGLEHLATPEAIYAGRLSGPWTLVRRELLANGDEEARAWAERITPVVVDLRARRRDPDAVDFDELRDRQEALIAEIQGHPQWIDVPGVAEQLDRIEDLFAAYDEAKAAEAARAQAGGADDEPAGEP